MHQAENNHIPQRAETPVEKQALFSTGVLAVIDGEPRMKDTDIGAALGMAQPLNIRKVIEKNRAELEGYGLVHEVREPIKSGKGRVQEVTAYKLNEGQAILLCMFSRTPTAAAVRHQIVTVFMAWRRQQTPADIEEASQPHRTKIVGEVRDLLIALHGRTSIRNAVAILEQRFGQDAAPSKSAVHCFWQTLAPVPPEPLKAIPAPAIAQDGFALFRIDGETITVDTNSYLAGPGDAVVILDPKTEMPAVTTMCNSYDPYLRKRTGWLPNIHPTLGFPGQVLVTVLGRILDVREAGETKRLGAESVRGAASKLQAAA